MKSGVELDPSVRLQLLSVPHCPNVGKVRDLALRTLVEVGAPGALEEVEGDYSSPTLLVDGVDVVTGEAPPRNAACRLDLPTQEQILAALGAAQQRRPRAAIRRAAFRRLLVTGAPVTPVALATDTDLSELDVEAGLRVLASEGRIHLAKGSVVGSVGLSVVPSRHELLVGGRRLWTWCAWDAVGILAALRASGVVHSLDPQTGLGIALPFTDGVPEAARPVVFRADDEGYASIREEYCPLTNLFQKKSAAQAWARDRQVRGRVIAVREAAVEAAAEWRELVAGLTLSWVVE